MSGTPLDLRERRRKRYSPPVVKRVQVRPEEAVLGFCKTRSSAGPLQSLCQAPGGACSGAGS